MDKYSTAMAQANGVRINGKNFRRREPLFIQPCNSQTQTGVAAGTKITFNMPQVTEKENILAQACRLNGVPVVVGILLTVTQSVSIPTVAGGSGDPLLASMFERRALDVAYLQPGKASQFYQQTRTTDPLPELLDRLMVVAPDACKAMIDLCPDTQTSEPRLRVDDSFGVTGSLDYTTDSQFRGQATFDRAPVRVVYPGATAGPIAEPATGTVLCDAIPLPLTCDGSSIPGAHGSGFGCEDSGLLFNELFDTANQWYLYYTPQNNTNLYRTFAGETPTFGTFTVKMYIVYRVAPADKPVLVGNVWNWNRAVATWDASSQFVDLPADAIYGSIMHGWFRRVWPGTNGGTNYLWQSADAGPATEYTPIASFIPPRFSPAANLFTLQSYAEIGDGQRVEWPFDGQQTHYGWELVSFFNAIMQERTRSQYFSSRQWSELPYYGAVGQNTSTTSQFSNFTTRYGASYAAGAAYTTLAVNPGLTNGNSSLASTIGIGGVPYLPIGFYLPESKGFPGMACRVPGDNRPVRVSKKGNWSPPLLPDGTPHPIESIGAGPTYSNIGVAAECCDPCGNGGNTMPVASNPASTNAPMGQALSTTNVLNPGFQASLTTG